MPSTEKFGHQGDLWTPGEGNIQEELCLLPLRNWWEGWDFFHYPTGRIVIPGAVSPPPVPDLHQEMMEVLFSSPAKDEAAMAGKRLQSLSLNK